MSGDQGMVNPDAMQPTEISGRYTLDYLDEDQRSRVAALHESRVVLTMGVPRDRMKPAEFPYELLELAQFILSGETPDTKTERETTGG